MKSKILIIYTGGTIGMRLDPDTNTLKPFDFESLNQEIPEIKKFDYQIDVHAFDELIDSSDMKPQNWLEIASVIEKNYHQYDGFVILHGTDTMAYTASALSFMLENLSKPVVLTGSQLPIGTIRTDGKENLITAIEIAAAKSKNGLSIIPEVCIYFEYTLLRGNRSTKHSAEHFDAFKSFNYPDLAKAGIDIYYNKEHIFKWNHKDLIIHKSFEPNVVNISMFPGMSPKVFNTLLNIEGVKGVVLETYGAGNATTENWFKKSLKHASERGLLIINITQSESGGVSQGKYETSSIFNEIGVVSGYDLTREAAIIKMMFALANYTTKEEQTRFLNRNIIGEQTVWN